MGARHLNVDGKHFRTIWPGIEQGTVEIIDQTKFPHVFETVTLYTMADVARAIKDMQVRGCNAILG